MQIYDIPEPKPRPTPHPWRVRIGWIALAVLVVGLVIVGLKLKPDDASAGLENVVDKWEEVNRSLP